MLDPTTPPEGKPRRQYTKPGDPPTDMERRAESLGIHFSRGRTWTANSHLAHELSEFAAERYPALDVVKPLFKAYFDDLEDIGKPDVVLRIGADAGLPEAELREALYAGAYRQQVDDALEWSRDIGVSAVPTFLFDERMAVVGAQDLAFFEHVMQKRLGREPKATG